MPTVRNGGATSGNSSVFSLSSANMPKMTSATIATTVIERPLDREIRDEHEWIAHCRSL